MKRLLIAVLVLVLAALACNGGDSSGEKVGEVQSVDITEQEKKPPQVEKFHVGDIIKVEDHTIILNSTEFSGNMFIANFTVENFGSEELTVSSFLRFTARDGEGTRLDQAIFDCPTALDGTVHPGDKIRGDLCFKVKPETELVKLYYEASLFSEGAVIWEANK